MKKTTGMDRSITGKWRPATQAVRGGTWRSEHGETSEALFLTSGYTYDDAQTVADRFAGEDAGMTYSRLQNPTVAMLEERIALMEGAEACRAQASGMAAMTTALLCQLSAGDHVVGARAAFGSCRWLVDHLLPRFGIETSVIDSADNDAWEAAIRPNTKVFFFETPANPTLDVVDLAHVCSVARAHGITTVVDNAFATSALQRPMDFGADVVAYSATKLMDGQGRVLAGAVCGSREFIDEVLLPFQRNTGPNISPFNAWVVHKGIETLDLRARRQSANAVALGAFIENAVSFADTRVNVVATWTADQIMVTISDDGPGFAAEVLPKLGEPYVSQRGEAHLGGGDMGLGFFIAKTLIERTGGRIATRNRTPPKRGAVVQTLWPLTLLQAPDLD